MTPMPTVKDVFQILKMKHLKEQQNFLLQIFLLQYLPTLTEELKYMLTKYLLHLCVGFFFLLLLLLLFWVFLFLIKSLSISCWHSIMIIAYILVFHSFVFHFIFCISFLYAHNLRLLMISQIIPIHF